MQFEYIKLINRFKSLKVRILYIFRYVSSESMIGYFRSKNLYKNRTTTRTLVQASLILNAHHFCTLFPNWLIRLQLNELFSFFLLYLLTDYYVLYIHRFTIVNSISNSFEYNLRCVMCIYTYFFKIFLASYIRRHLVPS